MIYGYARVSSSEQNLDRQIIELKKYVPEDKIVVDKESGKNFDRPGYQALTGVLGLREGDTLYITSLDRLSRNKEDIKAELKRFKEKRIRVKILDLPTSLITVPEGQEWIADMINNILIEVLSSIAQQERLTIRKRQKEGIAAARAKGKHLGRPRIKIDEDTMFVIGEWKKGTITASNARKHLNISKSSFYRLVKRIDEVSKG